MSPNPMSEAAGVLFVLVVGLILLIYRGRRR